MTTSPWLTIDLDGSLHDATTIEWGLAEARLRGAPVLLVRVVPDHGAPVQTEWYPSPHHPLHTEAMLYLRSVADREGARRPGLQPATRLVPGPRERALEELSRTSQLLVVGPRPEGLGVGPALVRSMRGAAHVAAHAACPVALVTGRSGGPPAAPVVSGVDGSPQSAVAAELAAQEAALRGAPLVLLHAATSGWAHREPHGRHGRTAAHAADRPSTLDEVVEAVRARHPALTLTLDVVRAAPAEALVERSRTAALVVVGTRGRGAVREGLLGSVSSEVARRADGTVLVVHDPLAVAPVEE